MDKYYCRNCNAEVKLGYTWTDYNKALCPLHFAIENVKICFACFSKEAAKVILKRLLTPTENCIDCCIKDTCSRSKDGPEDLRDDWPHAISKLGEPAEEEQCQKN